ncbi:hexose-6-phosphate:phosphate antiporter, partial [Ralstonia insidiosa]|nr:hexose-6-phosphate:phosphate antiporter [Ralstonia insidiosa]
IFGYTLSGWTDVFIVFYVALFLGMILLAIVAYYEEKKIRKLKI